MTATNCVYALNTKNTNLFFGYYYMKNKPATKCIRSLTFLDYTTLEATGKSIEAKLSEKEKEIQLLRQRDSMNRDAIACLSDKLAKVMQEIEVLKKQK
jgi:hypothetical protein